MRASWLIAAVPACLAFAAASLGCSAQVSASNEAADAESNSSTAAIVVVERSGTSDTARGEAVARFMRVRGVTGDDALRMVGATVDLPTLGSCVSMSTLSAGRDAAPTVQLLDVGAVVMEANGVHTALHARQVPDVVDVVSGVVYARATDGELLPARTQYVLRVAGAQEAARTPFEGFAVTASAPGDPLGLRIGGEDARGGSVALDVRAAAGGVDLAWEAENEADTIYVDVTAAAQPAAPRTPTIRCAFTDVGRATLPPSAFAAGDDGTMSIHRLHRERFRARGVDAGEVRFDFARLVTFSRR